MSEMVFASLQGIALMALGLYSGYRMGKSKDNLSDSKETQALLTLSAPPTVVVDDLLATLQKENLELKKELAFKAPLMSATIKLGQERRYFAEVKSDPKRNGGQALYSAEQDFQRAVDDYLNLTKEVST